MACFSRAGRDGVRGRSEDTDCLFRYSDYTAISETAIVKRLAKEGKICAVFGHRYGEEDYRLATYKPGEVKDGFVITIKESKPAGWYRVCELCGKEQRYIPEKWEEITNDR